MSWLNDGFLYKKPDKGVFIRKPGEIKVKTYNFGLYLPLKLIPDGIHDRYYSLIFKYLEIESNKKGYNLILFTRTEDIYPFSSLQKVDGLVVSYTWTEEMEKDIKTINQYTPVVLIDNYISDKSIPAVLINNYRETYKTIEYLIKLNHKNIGYVAGSQESPVGRDKLKAYKDAMKDNGLAKEGSLVYPGNYRYKSGYDSIQYFVGLPSFPTAIVCANDTMALGLIDGLKEKGHRIPEDVSVIGFDDITEASELSKPLTTIHPYLDKMAEKCVEILLMKIRKEEIESNEFFIRSKLIIRKSLKRYDSLLNGAV